MTRVLLTGASGLIGRHAPAALRARGYEVHAVRSAEDDLLAPGVAEDVVARVRPDALLHFAWVTEHGRYWTSPLNLAWLDASLRLLMAFQAAGGRRVVMAGSCAEYDWGRPAPYSEAEEALGPASLYGASKDALRRVASAYAAQEGVSLAWGRIFFPIGAGEAPARLVPSVARALRAGERAAVSSGVQIRDFLAASDVADGFAALLASDVEGPVNVAAGRGTSIREVVEAVARITGGADRVDFGALADRPGDPPEIVADITRLRDEVGWRPSLSLDDAVAAAIQP